MGNFIFGMVVVGVIGVILYLYLKKARDADVEKRRVTLNALKNAIDEGSPLYRKQVDDYNDFVLANADVLRKHGIDPTTITRKNFVNDVRSGRVVDAVSGIPVEVTPTEGLKARRFDLN